MKVRGLMIFIAIALVCAAGFFLTSPTKVSAGCNCHYYGASPGSTCSSWSGFWQICGETNVCGNADRNCWGWWCYLSCDANECGQTFSCACNNSGMTCPACSNCPDRVSCPTSCGSGASDQPDGNCGTHHCNAVTPPAYVDCPTSCGHGASDQPNGSCGTHHCNATAPCCNSNFNMTISDTNSSGTCNNAVFTLSGLPGTHKQPSGGNINTVVNGSSTLCTNNNWPLQNPFSCGGVTSPGITWTHNWREFDGSQYSVDCTKTVTVNYPFVTPVPCLNSSELTVDFIPKTVYYNDPIQKYTLFASYTLHSPDFTNLSQVTVTAHNPLPGFVSCNPWTVNPIPGTLTTNNDQTLCSPSQFGPYNFSYAYNLRHPTCTNITTYNCSATSPTATATYFPGFLQTEKGDTYLGGPFTPPANNMPADQVRYPLQPPAYSMSTFTFSSNQSGNTIYLPSGAICTSSPAVCSYKNYLLFNYNDNNISGASNWYTVLKTRLDQDPAATKDTNTYTNPTWNSGAPFFDTSKTVINVTNNLTINSGATCQGKYIILVGGDLIINPDFTYQGDNGCLFIVNGNTSVNDSYGSTPRKDTVQAFIITNTISTPLRASPAASQDNWLNIKGGVITTNLPSRDSNANFWGRNVNYNSAHNIYQAQYSELLTYEGARYINFFGQYLSDSSLLSIRELQYNP